jgi:hypothetical protein
MTDGMVVTQHVHTEPTAHQQYLPTSRYEKRSHTYIHNVIRNTRIAGSSPSLTTTDERQFQHRVQTRSTK